MSAVLALYHEHKLALLAIGLVLAGLVAWLRRDTRLSKMPGPKGYPLIGIGLSLPAKAHVSLREWATSYGEVFRLRVGMYNWVIINSPQAMHDILNKQVICTPIS